MPVSAMATVAIAREALCIGLSLSVAPIEANASEGTFGRNTAAILDHVPRMATNEMRRQDEMPPG
jgi:hypothetical protein